MHTVNYAVKWSYSSISLCTPPSNVDTNDGWMIYHNNLQTIICGLSEWTVHKNAKGRLLDSWWTSVWTENCVLPSGVTAIRLAMGQTYYIILLIFWSGWGRQAGSGETWTSIWVSVRLNGWLYVARTQGVAILFKECRYGQWSPGWNVFTWTVICSQLYLKLQMEYMWNLNRIH